MSARVSIESGSDPRIFSNDYAEPLKIFVGDDLVFASQNAPTTKNVDAASPQTSDRLNRRTESWSVFERVTKGNLKHECDLIQSELETWKSIAKGRTESGNVEKWEVSESGSVAAIILGGRRMIWLNAESESQMREAKKTLQAVCNAHNATLQKDSADAKGKEDL